MHTAARLALAFVFAALVPVPAGGRQVATRPPEALRAAIDRLGSFEHADRSAASKLVRRAPAQQAVPLLVQAVRSHKDGYVRFRAGVLLTGFSDPGTPALMAALMADVNDRLRQREA